MIEEQVAAQELTEIPQDTKHFIQAQARVAFSKTNRAAGYDMEDFISIGYAVYWKALQTWDAAKGSKFNTYLTMCLQRSFYKVNSKTMRKKRGGAGNKAEDYRFGRGYRWETDDKPQGVIHISLCADIRDRDETELQLPTNTDFSPEYDVLLGQVEKLIPIEDHRVFKQMVDPDPELLEIAASYARESKTRKCTISLAMLQSYLKMSKAELNSAQERIRAIVAQHLGLSLAF